LRCLPYKREIRNCITHTTQFNVLVCLTVAIDAIKIPTSIQEAMKDSNWIQAMREEIKALEKSSTWDIVYKHKDKKIVGYRWVYTMKCKSNGTLDQYKARLVPKIYTQTYGIDYEETFALVAKMNTIKIILSLEVYIEILLGFESHGVKNKVCKLKKDLYGLTQSPQVWFGKFNQVMISLGYKQSQGDHTLFIKHSLDGKLTFFLVYVDDMIITCDDEIE
ncbi:hypothetical protein CR513_35075, partial [Mucuna pruriens]